MMSDLYTCIISIYTQYHGSMRSPLNINSPSPIFLGDTFAYDARSGAIGDTDIRLSTHPPCLLQRVVMTVRPRHKNIDTKDQTVADQKKNYIVGTSAPETEGNDENIEPEKEMICTKINIDARQIIRQLSASLLDCIVSSEDIYTTHYKTQHCTMDIVVRVDDLSAIDRKTEEEEEEEEEKYEILETRRGIIGEETDFFLLLENSLVPLTLQHSPKIPTVQPHKDLISVFTKDEEMFPVMRKLLRPCIALTSMVQMGRGIYSKDVHNSDDANDTKKSTEETTHHDPKSTVKIDVDACTFDKVLLFLEHEVTMRCHATAHSIVIFTMS